MNVTNELVKDLEKSQIKKKVEGNAIDLNQQRQPNGGKKGYCC